MKRICYLLVCLLTGFSIATNQPGTAFNDPALTGFSVNFPEFDHEITFGEMQLQAPEKLTEPVSEKPECLALNQCLLLQNP